MEMTIERNSIMWKTLVVLMLLVVPVQAAEKELTPQDYKAGYEDAAQQVKTLQWELYHSDRFITIGRTWYNAVLEEVRELRRENTAVKKQLQTARDYLEHLSPKPVYISDITGKMYNETESPLYRENVARRIVEENLKREKEDRSLDRAYSEAEISRLNNRLYTVGQERDTYKKQVDQDRLYFQSLIDNGILPKSKVK